jgi:hypothetical protein
MALMDGDCRTDGIEYLIEVTEWIASAKHGSKEKAYTR